MWHNIPLSCSNVCLKESEISAACFCFSFQAITTTIYEEAVKENDAFRQLRLAGTDFHQVFQAVRVLQHLCGTSVVPPRRMRVLVEAENKRIHCAAALVTAIGDAANSVTNSSEVMRLKQKPASTPVPN